MTVEDRIRELLEEIMELRCTPEEVCAQDPELLPEVQKRWNHLQHLEHELGLFFPKSNADTDPAAGSGSIRLPAIEGYDIQSVLGRGGMGVVYRAHHLKLNRTVALKMLLSGACAGLHDVVRFQREAEAVAGLNHPNIVQVHDVGELDGQPFFTMEFVEGQSLAETLAGMPQPARRAASFVATLAQAVQVAHSGGIIHRDLKPSNVLLAIDGTPKIADFGLARRLQGDSDLTFTGARIGTPSYMAPEQAAGLSSTVGPPADIYSLGAILYETLTGRPPFRAETVMETERQVLTTDPVSPSRLNPQVPRDLNTICLKCLQKEPTRRYASAGELADDLRRFLDGRPVLARPIGWWERVWRWGKRNPDFATALSGIAVLLMFIVVGSLWAVRYFYKLEGEQRQLATDKGKLADQFQAQGTELRNNLYLTEMNLAGQSATLVDGLGRVDGLLERWRHERPDLRNWEWYYLNGLSHRNLLTLVNHGKYLYHLAWSPDGERLAAAGEDDVVCIWDASDEGPALRLTGHTNPVFSVAWSPDGRRIATASWDRTVRIWDTVSAAELYCFQGHKASVHTVAWSPDGSMIASGAHNQSILVWDPADGTIRHDIRGHEGKVASLAWRHDSRTLASGSHDTAIRVWDVANEKQTHTLRGHQNWVNQIAWNADGSRLASASNDGTVRIWNETGELQNLRGHTRGVQSVDWSPDGSRLVSCGDDQTARVWSVATGTELFKLRGHRASLNAVAWNLKYERIASGGMERNVRIWDAVRSPETVVLNDQAGPVECLAWCQSDPKLFASADGSGVVTIRDMTRHSVIWKYRGDESSVRSVAWSPAGEYLATANKEGLIRILDINQKSDVRVIKGHRGEICTVAWSPDGRRLASGGADQKIRIWDVNSGELKQTIEKHNHYIYSLAWSPEGRRLASGSGDTTIKIFDGDTGTELLCCRGHTAHVTTVAWSSDGVKLASGGHDKTVQLWDATTGQREAVLHGHASGVAQVTWSPNNQRLATAGREGIVKIWDPTVGREALSLTGHSGEVTAVAWSPNGAVLASGGTDNQIRIHDATSGNLAARITDTPSEPQRHTEAAASQAEIWRMRVEAHAQEHEWTQAADDAREYLVLRPQQSWLMLDCMAAAPYPPDLSQRNLPEDEEDFSHKARVSSNTIGLAQVNWKTVSNSGQGLVDFGILTDHADNVSGYALFPVYSVDERQIAIFLDFSGHAKLWLNGDLLYSSSKRRITARNDDAISAKLKSGWNRLLVRVARETGDHVLFLRLSDSPADLARVHESAK